MPTRILLTLAAACLLAACADRPAVSPPATVAPAATNPAATNTAATGGTTTSPPPVITPMPSPASSLPADFIVSTNEPFWQARVEGVSLTLVGPGAARSFIVESNEASAEGRRVLARDAAGTLAATISNQQCQDDMSGATFPYTGSLSFDGAVTSHGCARGLTDPLPVVPQE